MNTRHLERMLFWRRKMKTAIPVLALYHDPNYYPEHGRFDPERFNKYEEAKRHHYVYLPFGDGPTICIGKFAVQYLIFQYQ
jgi:cytochrome P450